MILDEYGRPIRGGNALVSPDWLRRESEAVSKRLSVWEAERRVHEMRNLVAFAEAAAALERSCIVGETITVKLPDRFK